MSWHSRNHRVSRPAGRASGLHSPFRQPLILERLESRMVPTVTVAGVANWFELGPGPITGDTHGVEGMAAQGSPPAGAIAAIAADPGNANRVFVATVNGGIWRTTNATDSTPIWTPLTDKLPDLSMGAIAFSPLDPTHNTLF